MSETNIRQLTKQDIPESVDVIRTTFLTVGKEFNITPENAPMFTALRMSVQRNSISSRLHADIW